VPTYNDLLTASDDAWGISDVTSLDNELLVEPVGETLVDDDLAAQCMNALEADRFVPKGAVQVKVADGWVTLSGNVRHHIRAKRRCSWYSGSAGCVGSRTAL
jgi:osmotically-inducible protein OsmY